MKKYLFFASAAFGMLIIGMYIGHSRGFSEGATFASSESGKQCLAGMYASARMPVYQSMELYRIVLEGRSELDSEIDGAFREAIRLNIQLLESTFGNLSPDQQKTFMEEHRKTIGEFEVIN